MSLSEFPTAHQLPQAECFFVRHPNFGVVRCIAGDDQKLCSTYQEARDFFDEHAEEPQESS